MSGPAVPSPATGPGPDVGRGRAAVLVVSTSAAADASLDRTGPVIVDWLRARGFTVDGAVVVADGGPIGSVLEASLTAGARVVITTGGTGTTPSDRTPEAVEPFIELPIPGVVEEIRRRGLAGAGARALLTRGVAGIAAGGAFVATLPGSRGGVADGLGVLDGLLDHVLAQVRGEGHPARDGASTASGEPIATETRPERQSSSSDPRAVSPDPSLGDRPTPAAPAAAGVARVLLADVVDEPIAVATVADLVETAADGAVVTFIGVVRDHDGGRGVAALEYERHPSASDAIAAVAESVSAEHPSVRIAVQHRVGALGIGDVAIATAVASAHRAEAFAACAELVDRIKDEVPIWKHQRFTDGTDEWVAAL